MNWKRSSITKNRNSWQLLCYCSAHFASWLYQYCGIWYIRIARFVSKATKITEKVDGEEQ